MRTKPLVRMILYALAAVTLFLAARLVWIASRTETGFETLAIQWRDATIGLVTGKYEPINSRDPDKQAEYWLAEVDRILAENPNNAELAMGAALVLNEPSLDFYGRYMIRERFMRTQSFLRRDSEAIDRLTAIYERACREKCLALARRATELEPDNVVWWRLRALLLWHDPIFSSGGGPRDPRYLEVLEEFASHDVNNALYDYMAADYLWDQSVKLVFQGDVHWLVVTDPPKFALATEAFHRGLAKPDFFVGDEFAQATLAFADRTKLSAVEREKVANSRTIRHRHLMILHSNRRWRQQLANWHQLSDDPYAALDSHRSTLRMIDQYLGAGVSKLEEFVLMGREATLSNIGDLTARHGLVLSNVERESLLSARKFNERERQIFDETLRRLNEKRPPPTDVKDSRSAILYSAIGLLPPAIVACGLIAASSAIGLRFLRPANVAPIRVLWPVTSLFLSIGASITLFGLFPAGIVGDRAQAWTLSASIVAAPLIAAMALAVWRWRRGHRRFGLRASAIAITVLCTLFAAIAVGLRENEWSELFPFDLSIPMRYDPGAPVAQHIGGAFWVAYQWWAWFGLYIALAFWMALLVVSGWRSSSRDASGGDSRRSRCRSFVSHWLTTCRRSTITLAAFLLTVYLALIPSVLSVADVYYQSRIRFARNNSAHWAEIEGILNQVRAEEERLDRQQPPIEAN